MSLECPHCDRAELESRCDELRSQVARLEGELAQAKDILLTLYVAASPEAQYSPFIKSTCAAAREVLVKLYNGIEAIDAARSAPKTGAAMRAKESSSTAEQSHPQSSTTP